MPCPRAIAAWKALRLFSTTPGPCSPRWAKGSGSKGSTRRRSGGLTSSRSLAPNGDNRIDLDRRAARQGRNAHRAPGMPPGLAEHLLHQLGCAVRDQRLVGEAARAVDEDAELHNPLNPLEITQRLLHLRQQHQPAGARRALAEFEIPVLA